MVNTSIVWVLENLTSNLVSIAYRINPIKSCRIKGLRGRPGPCGLKIYLENFHRAVLMAF
jgi:hypothetical protein